MRKLTLLICSALMFLAFLSVLKPETYVEGSQNVIKVPLNYETIQEAINHASNGDTILVSQGIYTENVVVNKSVSIVGENRNTTIVDGRGLESAFYVNVNNVSISNFTLRNGYSGVWLFNSNNCTVNRNNANNNAYGIKLYHSSNSIISNNNVNNNEWFGITLHYSGNCTLRNNSLAGNKFNFGVDGDSLFDFISDIDTSNTVDNKPIRYLINQHNLTIDSSTFSEIGYIAFINSTNISVKNLNLSSNFQGILFAYSPNCTMNNINATNNWYGIYLKNSQNCKIEGNNANNNFDYGITLRMSGSCTVSKNNVNDDNWGGISLSFSSNSMITENNVNNNYYGIHLVDSTNCVVTRNDVDKRSDGYSIVIYRSDNNVIYHNNFVNYFIYAYARSTNIWDNGLEGNHWKNYNGIDLYRGPYQNETGSDGIGDTPYSLDENNKDNYPLMGIISDFTVSFQQDTYHITLISNFTISNFNESGKVISFNVTGPDDTIGFCRISIPRNLVEGPYTVLVDGIEVNTTELPISNSTYAFLYFTYTHGSHQIIIVPEFSIVIVLPMTTALLLLSVFLQKRKKSTKNCNGL